MLVWETKNFSDVRSFKVGANSAMPLSHHVLRLCVPTEYLSNLNGPESWRKGSIMLNALCGENVIPTTTIIK